MPEKQTDPGNTRLLVVSSSPHAHGGASVRRIMLDVIIALVPALLVAVLRFGMDAARLTFVCVATCVLAEALSRKMMGRDLAVGDLSAVVTGILLAFNLPPSLPSWMAVLGSVFAIIIAKQLFGGIGYNPFNPALVGRVALLISLPTFMTRWSTWLPPHADAVTTATPLGMVKGAVKYGKDLPFACDLPLTADLLLGNVNGCLGEVSAIALILGGVYLLVRRCVTWHIPATYLGTVAAISSVLWIADPGRNLPPHFHLLAGGLMLGALFMATDMVTSPVTRKGQIVFGIGCGALTVLIRRWGGYPEGVSFAILLMNAVTPLINRATRPRVLGTNRQG